MKLHSTFSKNTPETLLGLIPLLFSTVWGFWFFDDCCAFISHITGTLTDIPEVVSQLFRIR